jgi:hypothetical protein
MNGKRLAALSLLACSLLSGCATTHGIRWVYGMESIHAKPDQFSEDAALRAIVGAPVILGSVAFDLVTWPGQLLFGVWPTWGKSSEHMKPKAD